MSSFSSTCRDLSLRLAYKTNFYPYFFKREVNAQYEGVYMEFWRTMTKILECESLEVEHYDEIRFCNGSMCTPYFDGAIGRQEVFAPALPVFLLPQDVFDYKYSVNVNWLRMRFYESVPREGMFIKASSLEFYTVFPIWMLVVFFVLRMVSALLFKLIDSVRKKHSSPTPSYFNGNNVFFEERTNSLLSSLAAQVANGKRNLLFETGSTQFDNEDLFNMFDSSNVGIYLDSVLNRLTMTCHNNSIVGFFFDVDQTLLSITPSLQDCVLSGIAIDATVAKVPWLSNTMINGDPYNFVFSRNVSSRVVEKVNFSLLSIYTADNLNSLFALRSFPFSELRRSMQYVDSITPLSNAITRATSLTSLTYPLIFLAIGLGVSVISLVMEIVYAKWRASRR